jgi:transposase-like protein
MITCQAGQSGVQYRLAPLSVQDKRRIVEDTFAPHASVAHVARRYGVSGSAVYDWRKLYCAGQLEREPDAYEETCVWWAGGLTTILDVEQPTRFTSV